MKPRNNKQREIMRLAQQLPPLSAAQQKWARRATFTRAAFATKQVAWCSDCGAIFAPIDNDKRCVCPKCGAKLKVERSRRLKLDENVYFTQLSVIGGYQVVRHYEARRYSRLRHAINIATRNGYRIKDASMWCDYIELLDYFNIDTHNAKYVCPANLRYEHDKLMHRKRIIEERERVAQERRRNLAKLESCAKAKAQYKKHKGRFLGVVLTQGALHASVLPDVETFMQEGEAMRHCVFTNEYYKRKDCLIFSVRDNKDNRVATVEFNLKTFEVVQCRGKANSQPKEYGEILKMFQLGAEQIRKIQQYKAS